MKLQIEAVIADVSTQYTDEIEMRHSNEDSCADEDLPQKSHNK